MASTPTSLELLELDIDLRLHVVLLEAGAHDTLGTPVAALLRLAYGAGYCDALVEPRRGELCREHGFAIPKRAGGR